MVDPILALAIAAQAQCDPRSVQKRLRGERVRGLAGARIDRVLDKRGLRPLEQHSEAPKSE
jgi:hypothetical protein